MKTMTKGCKQELRQNFLLPLSVNLLTGLIFFVSVLIFKDPIYDYFKPSEGIDIYPIYCVAEPYTDSNGQIDVDLFIINKSHESYDENGLNVFLRIPQNNENHRNETSMIQLKWKDGFESGEILRIEKDEVFNKGKGRLIVIEPDMNKKNWAIKVEEIEPKAIIKLKIHSSYEFAGVTRAAKSFVPFQIDYAGN